MTHIEFDIQMGYNPYTYKWEPLKMNSDTQSKIKTINGYDYKVTWQENRGELISMRRKVTPYNTSYWHGCCEEHKDADVLEFFCQEGKRIIKANKGNKQKKAIQERINKAQRELTAARQELDKL